MLRPRDALVCGLLVWGGASSAAPPSAAVAVGDSSDTRAQSGRKLTGRFLHITDFHPDPFYKTYSSTSAEAACHRKRGPAGIYGAETSGCDSPYSLVNETFRWIKDNIKDDIDFVIWTGDSARHDNDEKHARTQNQIIHQNEFLVHKFAEVFGVSDEDRRGINDYVIPIVPTFGNNDIMPHNIFLQGPNKWTMKYLDIWRSFIPEAQRHQFQQGGWFSVEVIPGKLAVVSLNTIYFFTSNSGVDGCANKHEPGYEHMEWLRIQLEIMRERGVKAILMGHVPPARVDSKESWDETCWQKYTLWVQQYRDVIVGSLYGHMNIDHFMLQDFEEINDNTRKGDMAVHSRARRSSGEIRLLEDGEVTVASASDYLLSLREFWAQLPSPLASADRKTQAYSETWEEEEEEQEHFIWDWLLSKISNSQTRKVGKSAKKKYLEKIGGKYAHRYSASLVAPSVVPNYFPTLRIIEYNITGLEHLHLQGGSGAPADQHPLSDHDFLDDAEYKREVSTLVKRKEKQKAKGRASKHSKKFRFKVPRGPSKSAPPGPAYSPQTLTWTRYTQYFANLTRINNDFVDPQHHRASDGRPWTSANEMAPRTIFGLQVGDDGKIESRGWKEGKHGKHNGKHPRPEPHPTEFSYEVEYDTKDKKFPDLTVRRWVEYARKIGGGGKKAAAVAEYEEDVDETEVGTEAMHDDELEAEGKKHKKHKKGKKHHKASKEWFTFVKRAFVGTMDPKEIKEVFGRGAPATQEAQEEIMEL